MKRYRTSSRIAALSLAVLALGSVAPVQAESDFQAGTGGLTATARLDFQVVIPKFLRLQVGTAGLPIDLVTFTVPAANVGDGTNIAGLSSGANPIPVLVQGNNGNIVLTGTTIGALNNGAGDTISFAQILETSSDATGLPSPDLVDGAGTAVTIAPNVGARGVNRSAEWTFAYDNTLPAPGAGTYGGIGVNNGRVTYTATLP